MSGIDNSLGESVLELRTDQSGLDKGIRTAKQKAEKLSKSFTSIGKKLTLGISTPIAGIATIAGKAAINIEKQQKALEVLLGSADKATKMYKEWQKFSAATPFKLEQITQAGKQLLAFGMSAESVTGQLEMLGDVAAGIDAPLNELASLYGKVKTQQTLYTEEILQFAERGIPIFEGLADVLNVSQDQIKDMASEGEIQFEHLQQVFENLTEEGGRFANMTEELAETTAGKLSTAFDNLKLGAAELGKQFIPIINKIAEFLSNFGKAIQNMDERTKRIITVIGGIAAAVGPAMLAIGGLIKVFGMAGTAFRTLGKLIAGAWPWGVLAAAVATIVVLVIKNWDRISEATKKLWKRLKTIFTNINDGIGKIVKSFALSIAGRFLNAFDRVRELFTDFGEKLKESAGIIFNPAKWGKGGLKRIWKDGITDAFTEGFEAAGDVMLEESDKLGREARESFQTGFGELGDLFKDGFSAVVEVSGELIDKVKELFGGKIPESIQATIDKFEELEGQVERTREAIEKGGEATRQAGGPGRIIGPPVYGKGYTPVPEKPPSSAKVPRRSPSGLPGAGGFLGAISNATSKLEGFAGELAQSVSQMGAMGVAVAMIKRVAGEVFASISDLANRVLSPLTDALTWFANLITAVIKPVLKALAPVIQILVEVFKMLVMVLNGGLLVGIHMLIPVIKTLGLFFKWLYEKIIKPIGIGFFTVFDHLAHALATVYNGLIAPVLHSMAETFAWLHNKVIRPVGNAILDAINWVVNKLIDGINSFIKLLNKIPGVKIKKLGKANVGGGGIGKVKVPGEGFFKMTPPDMSGAFGGLPEAGGGGPGGGTTGGGPGGGGGGATYQRARPVTINVYIEGNNFNGAGGLREFVILLRNELESLEVLQV